MWDFGDGTTSTEQNPTKTYLAAATRTAKVTVSDGQRRHRQRAADGRRPGQPQPDHRPPASTMTPQAGFAPLAVQLDGRGDRRRRPVARRSATAGTSNGDGTDDTTTQNPTFTYAQPGNVLAASAA